MFLSVDVKQTKYKQVSRASEENQKITAQAKLINPIKRYFLSIPKNLFEINCYIKIRDALQSNEDKPTSKKKAFSCHR